MRVLQGVEGGTNVVATSVSCFKVSVLVDSITDDYVRRKTRIDNSGALDLNRVAWELAESKCVAICITAGTSGGASGVNGGVKLGGDVGNLGSRILEGIVGVIRLVVVVVAVRIAGRGMCGELRIGGVARGLSMHWGVVSAP